MALIFPAEATVAINSFNLSQVNSSRTSLNLEGGAVEDMTIAPNGTIYVCTNSPNGIFTTTNGGATWSGPSGNSDMGSPSNVETDPSSNAYISSGIKLFKSSNNGDTWTELTGGRGDYNQALLYTQNKLLAASRDSSVDISSDGGATFTNVVVATGAQISFLASSPTAGTFFALVREGSTMTLYKSVDGGSSWSTTGKSGDYQVVGADPNDANHIVLAGREFSYTTNGGTSWLTMAFTPHGASVGHVTFRTSDSRLYVGASFTDDNGATEWHNMQDEATSFQSILQGNAFAIDPSNSNIMYIRSGRGMAKTTDNGSNWVDVVTGMSGVVVSDISQSTDKNTAWIAAHGGLAKTTNFTSSSPTWSFPIIPTTAIDFATSVWVNPTNANIVLAGAGIQLWRSADGGDTWTDTGQTIGGTVKDIEATPDTGTIYAAFGGNFNGGVVKSTDSGVSWVSTDAPSISFNALAIGSDGSVYAGAGKEFDSTAGTRGIFKYNGASWTQLSGDPSTYLINDILIVNSAIYAAGGETEKGGIFKSTDGGSTWTELTKGLPLDGWFKSLARESGSTSVLYASTGRPAGTSYIYKSMDGGNTWGLYYTGLKDEAFNCLLYDSLVGGSNTGVFNYKSKASLSLSKRGRRGYARIGKRIVIKTTLIDKATKKPLGGRQIRLYQKVRNRWKLIAKNKTKSSGFFNRYVKLRSRNSYFKTVWAPGGRRDKNNYLSVTSGVLKVVARR